MIVNLHSDDGRPLYIQIMDEMRRAIVIGAFRPEEPLPSVRELAAELLVNPRTVSQAYHELEREGVVYVRRGQGTFVSPSMKHGAEERRRSLAREVARRALLEARRHALDVADLVATIEELAAEERDSTAPAPIDETGEAR